MPLRLLKVVPAFRSLVPPEVGDPEFEMKLHDHRYALSASVVLLLLIAMGSYFAAFMPWSPVRLALGSEVVSAEEQVENLKRELDYRLVQVEVKIEKVERAVLETGLQSQFAQLQSHVRALNDAVFTVERAIQQRVEEGRPSDRIYVERKTELREHLRQAENRLRAFNEKHAELIRDWTLDGAVQ